MRTRAYVAAVLLSICSVAVPCSTALAQERDVVTESARRRFQEGVRFFDKGKYEEARAAFLQAYALKHHPAVLLNLAQSELRSTHPVEAARHFAAFLREANNASSAERGEAEKALAQLRSKLGRIHPTVNATGATIVLDGETVGESPLPEPIDAAPGTHTVEAKLGGRVISTTLSVSPGKVVAATLNFDNAPAAAVIADAASAAPAAPATGPASGAAEVTEKPSDAAERRPSPAPSKTDTVPPAHAADEETVGFFGWVQDSPFAWVSLGLTGVGIAAFAAGGIGSVLANDNASAVSAKIEQKAREWNIIAQNLCGDPISIQLQSACATWRDNIDTRETDIKIATAGAVVAGVGLVATIVGYAVSSPKKHEHQTDHARSRSFLAARPSPWIGPSGGGLVIQGAF